jgi:hypothetical protein
VTYKDIFDLLTRAFETFHVINVTIMLQQVKTCLNIRKLFMKVSEDSNVSDVEQISRKKLISEFISKTFTKKQNIMSAIYVEKVSLTILGNYTGMSLGFA